MGVVITILLADAPSRSSPEGILGLLPPPRIALATRHVTCGAIVGNRRSSSMHMSSIRRLSPRIKCNTTNESGRVVFFVMLPPSNRLDMYVAAIMSAVMRKGQRFGRRRLRRWEGCHRIMAAQDADRIVRYRLQGEHAVADVIADVIADGMPRLVVRRGRAVVLVPALVLAGESGRRLLLNDEGKEGAHAQGQAANAAHRRRRAGGTLDTFRALSRP